MRPLLATFMLMMISFATLADAPLPQTIQRKEETLKLEEENGKKVLKLTGKQEVSVEALLRAWVEASGNQLLYHASQFSAYKCTIAAPEGEKVYGAEGLELLAVDALWQFKLMLVELSPGHFQICQANEAPSYSPIVSEQELANVPTGRFVCLRFHSSFAQLLAQRRAASMATSGVMLSNVGDCVILWGRAEQLRDAVRVVRDAEGIIKRIEPRAYEATRAVDASLLSQSIENLAQQGEFAPKVKVIPLPQARLVLVFATPEQHAVVTEALRKLDVAIQPGGGGVATEVRRYEVPDTASLEDVLESLNNLFSQGRGTWPRIAKVPGKHALIVRGTAVDHREFEQALKLITKE